MYIVNYACTTAAGPSVASLMKALRDGQDTSQPAWAGGRACFLDGQIEKADSAQQVLENKIEALWK